MNELLDKKLEDLATKEGIDEIKLLIKGLNERIDTQSKEISSLKEKVNFQETKISQLEDLIGILSSCISTIKHQADNNEQYSRRYCLRIKGIAKEKGESSAKCVDRW